MSNEARPLLRAAGLQKGYRLRGAGGSRAIVAVDDVSLDVTVGETLAIVGESGCGKSTLARLITRLEQPDAGEITFEGRPVEARARRAYSRDVQMVFQDPFGSLTPHFRVGTLVAEPLRIHGLASGRELTARVEALFTSVGLAPEISRRFPHELSGGQRQRVSIARAIATQPRLVVCDEPVSALDVSVRSQIINLLIDLQRELGLAYVFISHDLGLVDHIADQVAVMYLGRFVETAPANRFFDAPLHPYSRALIASTPVPDPSRRRVPPPVHDEAAAVDAVTGCPFRNRCPLAVAHCAESRPPLRELAPNHRVACHRAEETGLPWT